MTRTSHIVVLADRNGCGQVFLDALRQDGYRDITVAPDPEAAIALCHHLRVDVLLLELDGDCSAGLRIIEELSAPIASGSLHVIVAADGGASSQLAEALRLGARDFLRRPVEPGEVALRVRNRLAAAELAADLRASNADLQKAVVARSAELAVARGEILAHLAAATEFRDDETGEHTERVGRTAAAIASGVGLAAEAVRMIRAAAPLHDVGKIGIPDRILLKPGALTGQERAIMQRHTRIGAAILADSEVPELRLAEQIALSHHERFNGSGYPFGVSGASIPITARIVAIADVFDALVFERPYKPAWPLERALEEIASQRGRHFDPALVDVFLALDHAALMSPVRAATELHHLVHAPLNAGPLDDPPPPVASSVSA